MQKGSSEYAAIFLPTAEKHRDRMYLNEPANFLLQESDVERQLDFVELNFRYIDRLTREYYLGRSNAKYLFYIISQWNLEKKLSYRNFTKMDTMLKKSLFILFTRLIRI